MHDCSKVLDEKIKLWSNHSTGIEARLSPFERDCTVPNKLKWSQINLLLVEQTIFLSYHLAVKEPNIVH